MQSGCNQDAIKSASRSAYRSAQRRLSASGEYAHGPLRIHEERADVTPSKGALLAEAASRDRALDELGLFDRMLAVLEAAAHLDVLVLRGDAVRSDDGTTTYGLPG